MSADSSTPCEFCGATAELVTEPQEVTIGRRTAVAPQEFYRCLECGEEFLLPGQYELNRMRAVREMRVEEGLVLPEEIRTLRQTYCLTQEQLEHLMDVGPKTVIRWENGSVFQGSAANTLLRLLMDSPSAMADLATMRDIELPELAAASVYHVAFDSELWTFQDTVTANILTRGPRSAVAMSDGFSWVWRSVQEDLFADETSREKKVKLDAAA